MPVRNEKLNVELAVSEFMIRYSDPLLWAGDLPGGRLLRPEWLAHLVNKLLAAPETVLRRRTSPIIESEVISTLGMQLPSSRHTMPAHMEASTTRKTGDIRTMEDIPMIPTHSHTDGRDLVPMVTAQPSLTAPIRPRLPGPMPSFATGTALTAPTSRLHLRPPHGVRILPGIEAASTPSLVNLPPLLSERGRNMGVEPRARRTAVVTTAILSHLMAGRTRFPSSRSWTIASRRGHRPLGASYWVSHEEESRGVKQLFQHH